MCRRDAAPSGPGARGFAVAVRHHRKPNTLPDLHLVHFALTMRLVRPLLSITFQDRSRLWLRDLLATAYEMRGIMRTFGGNSVMPTYHLTRRVLAIRLELYLLATALSVCASLSGGLVASP